MMTGRLKLTDTSDMKGTIGLCVKNAEKTIRECLKCILNQDYPHELREIIMVDGKSTDNTLEIAENMISKSNISSKLHFDDGKELGRARQIVLDNTYNARDKILRWNKDELESLQIDIATKIILAPVRLRLFHDSLVVWVPESKS